MVDVARGIGIRLLAVCLAVAGMPRPAWAGQEVRCESHGMRRAYCSTGKHGTVRLLDASGLWPCKENETWGTETEGIWVDRGCKGRFFVDDPHGDSKDKHAAAVIAGVVGIGILAAVMASKNKQDGPPPDGPAPPTPAGHVPVWLIGTYHGYSPSTRNEAAMQVGSNGRVAIQSAGRTAGGIWDGDDRIRIDDGSVYNVSRTADGLRMTNTADRRTYTDFYRDR